MFDEALAQQFTGQQAELSRALYRRYVLQRELGRLDEDITRMAAGMAELERVRKNWDTQKAIDEAAADKDKEKQK